jgi:GGDEF domain-containing protein
MGRRTSNGAGKAPATVFGEARLARSHNGKDEAPLDVASVRLMLAAAERRFAAALRQLERMRRRDALHQQQLALLQEAAAKAQRLAYHDELTGLPNRHLLLDRFNQVVALAARHDKHVGLLFLDLERFKEINDTLGHSAGDQLLKQVASRVVSGIRSSDTACRYGGDEFVVLLVEPSGREGARAVAEGLRVQTLPCIGTRRVAPGRAFWMPQRPRDATGALRSRRAVPDAPVA